MGGAGDLGMREGTGDHFIDADKMVTPEKAIILELRHV